jgi:hypothetical protein
MTRRPNHRAGAWAALAALAALGMPAASHALEAIVLEVQQLEVDGMVVRDASARLDLLDDEHTRLTVAARGAALPDPVGRLTDLQLVCPRPVVAEPRFGCEAGHFSARGGPTGSLDMNVTALMHTDTGITAFTARDLAVAGTTATIDGRIDPRGWQVKAATGAARLSALRKLAAPWFELPADITGDGNVALNATLADSGAGLSADLSAKIEAVDLTNESSTVVTDKLAAFARIQAQPRGKATQLVVNLKGTGGQALAETILLDFGANPLDLEARGTLQGEDFTLASLRMTQKDLLDVSGSGHVDLAGEIPALTGDFELNQVQFPAAFSSYVAITLAASVLGDARTSGSLTGELSIVDNGVGSLHVKPRDLDLHADKGLLNLVGMNGEIFWAPAGGAAARVSRLGWRSGGAYGLSGGAAEIEFVAYGLNFALTRPARLPVFDGAIAIDHFVMGNLGARNMEVSFKGEVEPISMPLLAKAFGWPEFSGTLAAAIPSVTLKNDVLTFDGNVESQVFGGRVVGSNIRLQDPLGNFPRFFADVRARDLDLGQVTQTFEVGSITGKLEADVLGLELFAWSPQAFDARLATPKGDKSRHRISARAVSSLSNVGGGGGGVVQALQSGVLKFFDEYSYEKLGIRCRLRGDVCEMSGVEPAPNGYYIVKGSGIPRIDIVGNQGRVRWSQLMSSISTADFGGGEVK